MNFRHTAILFGSLLVGVVILLIIAFMTDAPSDDALFTGLGTAQAEDIDALEIDRTDPPGTLKLSRVGTDQWMITEPITAKADTDTVNAVIKALLKAQPTTFQEMPTASGAGLLPPSLKITLRKGTDRSATLHLGNVTLGNSGVVFVALPTRANRPIAIPRNNFAALFRPGLGSTDGKAGDLAKWTPDFRVRTIFPSEVSRGGDDVALLKLSLPNRKKELALSRNSSGGWVFDFPTGWGEADPVGDTTSVDGKFSGVRPLLLTLTSLRAAGPDDFVDNPKDLKEYGLNLDNPDLVRVELKTKNGMTIVAFLGKREPSSSTPGAAPVPGSPEKVWVQVEGQPGVIRATASDLAGLIPVIENPDPLRNRTLLAEDRSRIDGLDITVGGRTTKLRKTGAVPEWKLYGNASAGDPQAAAAIPVNRILDVLTERRTIKSFPASQPANFAPGEIKAEIKVWADGFEAVPTTDPKAEPKEKGKPTVLLFGKKEGDSVSVRRTLADGTTAEFLLPERIKVGVGGDGFDLIDTITKSRLDLLDPALKTFAADNVDKITVTGTANYELVKDEKKDPSTNTDRWTFASPADKKGQTADEATVAEMLRILGTTQSVTRFVDETPSPEKLAEYGLAPSAPRLKVVIGLKSTDPAEKERVYLFGKETSDPTYVYAQQVGKAAVFTVPKLIYDRFANADLRDRAIFRFDPTTITAIEIKGWEKLGFPFDLHAEKNKEGVWVATKPEKFSLDPAKLSAFISLLSKTRVKAFVAGMPGLEHGFGDKEKEYLHILLKRGSEPPIAIQLGGLTSDGQSYYGWTSLLPPAAPLFTVDTAPFKPYKESYGAFAR
jgi:hypothetical protein